VELSCPITPADVRDASSVRYLWETLTLEGNSLPAFPPWKAKKLRINNVPRDQLLYVFFNVKYKKTKEVKFDFE